MTFSSPINSNIPNTFAHPKLLVEHYQKYIHFTTEKVLQFSKPTTIHHWQLRDLIHCYWNESTQQDELFFITDDSIVKLNAMSHKSAGVIDLDFRPVCFHLSFPFLIVGGQDGHYLVKDLSTHQFFISQGRVGTAINNSIHAFASSPNSSQRDVFICNNDCTIKVFQISPNSSPIFKPIHTISLNIPVNYCCMNYSGQILAAVSDEPKVFLYDAKQRYSLLKTFKDDSADGSLCCSFDPYGLYLSVSCQDGFICMYDMRMMKLLKKFQSVQSAKENNGKGACRTGKFAPYPLDLFLYAEHLNMIHFIDTRDWETEQIIDLRRIEPQVSLSDVNFLPRNSNNNNNTIEPQESVYKYQENTILPASLQYSQRQDTYSSYYFNSKNIAGLCFSESRKHAYVATTQGIIQFEIDTMARCLL